MTKQLLTIYFMLLTTFPMVAQTITGKVTDGQTGETLPNASISVTSLKNGTNADENGNYTIHLKQAGKYQLKISFIGYETQHIPFTVEQGKSTNLSIQLKPATFLQDQVVVSANKIATNRDQVPLNITVISKEEIEKSSESNVLPIISSQVPGLFVTERGVSGFGLAPGSAGKISIRGVGGSESSFPVLVLIDGQPQFMGIFGHPIPDSYASSDIEKVEIVKGPASILYGSNAMGGVINMITKQPEKDGFGFKGRAMLGSFSTWKLNGSTSYKKENFSAFASWNHDETDGHRANSAFKIDNGFVKLQYKFNEHFSIAGNVNRSDFKAYDPGSIYSSDPSIYDNNSFYVDIVRTSSYFTLSNKYDKMEGGMKVYYMNGDHLVTNGPDPDWNSTDENLGFSVYQGLKLFPGNLISVGLDAKKYGGKGSPVVVPKIENGQMVGMQPSPYNNRWISVSETGLYAIVQQQVANKLTLNAGIRYESHSIFGDEWIPQFGAALSTSENTKLKASVSKGFRNPSIRELYLFPPANPNLQPEEMWNYELGLMQFFLDKKLSVEATVFQAEGSNLIMVLPNLNPPPAVINENSGDFLHTGIELDAKYHINDQFNLHGSYSYLNMDSPKVSSPEHQLFLGANYLLNKFNFNLNILHIGNLYTNIAPEATQDYTLVNAKVDYQLTSNIQLFLSGENLLDEKYEIQYGYTMPGIAIFSGINLKF